MLSPIIDQVKEQLAVNPNVSVQKINVDENPELATQYNIRSLPTIIIFNDVGASWAKSGIATKDVLVNKIKEFLQ